MRGKWRHQAVIALGMRGAALGEGWGGVEDACACSGSGRLQGNCRVAGFGLAHIEPVASSGEGPFLTTWGHSNRFSKQYFFF